MKRRERLFVAALGLGLALVIAAALLSSPALFMAGTFTAMGSLSIL